MADDSKNIRLTFAVDEQSAQKSQRIIQGIIKDLNTLVTTAQAASRAMAFGTSGGVAVSGQRLGPGTGGASHASASKANVGGGMVGVVSSMGTAFKGMADSGKISLKSMEDAVHRTVGNSITDIRELNRQIEQLSANYGKLPGMTAPLAGGSRAMTNQQQTAAMAGAFYGGGGPPQAAAPVTAPGAAPVPTAGGGGGRGGGIMNNLANIVGINPRMLTYGGAALAGAAVYNAMANVDQERAMASLAYRVDRPVMDFQRAAAGGMLASGAQAMRRGSISGGMVFADVVGSEQGRSIFRNQEERLALAAMRSGLLTDEKGRALSLASINKMIGRGVEVGAGKLLEGAALRGLSGESKTIAGRSNVLENLDAAVVSASGKVHLGGGQTADPRLLAYNKAKEMIATEAAQAFQEAQAFEAQNATKLRLRETADEVYAGAMGRFGMARAARRGLVVDPKTGLSGLDRLEIEAQRRGRDVGQYAAMGHAFGAQAGWGYFGAGQSNRYMSMAEGGLTNVASLFGAGAQFGGGAGFINTINRAIGRGGVDVTAGGQLGGTLSGYMMRGNFEGDASAAARSVLGMGFTGDPGQDMRRARILTAGMAQSERYAQGIDPLNIAMNTLFSARAAPGIGAQNQRLLRDIAADPAVVAQFNSTGALPAYAASAGITPEIFGSYQRQRRDATFTSYIADNATESGRAVQAFKASGIGLEEFIYKQYQGGLTGKETKRDRARLLETAIRPFAVARQVAGEGTYEQNLGSLLFDLSSKAEGLTGKGIGDIGAAGSLEEAGVKTEAQLKKDLAEFKGKDPARKKELEDAIKNIRDRATQAETMGFAGASGSLVALAKAAENAARALSSKEGPVTAGAPRR